MHAVTYHTAPYKALSLSAQGSRVAFDDFTLCHTTTPSQAGTAVSLWYDTDSLYMHLDCFEPDPAQIKAENHTDGMSIWKGDIIEIFFGAIEPYPWQIQLGVAAGGGRFDSMNRYDRWSADVKIDASGWHADIRLPLSFFRLQNLSMGFNLCRQRLAAHENIVWSQVQHGYHEVENYGEIFFCDYSTAYFALTGELKEIADRSEFEKAVTAAGIPATQVTHGPFLLNPDTTTMSVAWDTAGMCGALLEYRKKGSAEWVKAYSELKKGVLEQNHSSHRVDLTDLEPGTEYEYRIASVHSISQQIQYYPGQGNWTFRTFDPQKEDFSFGLCSDLHSDAGHLEKLLHLPETASTDFWVHLGDFLSHASGVEAFYSGFLDLSVRDYGSERPLVFVRGNHEQVGLFAGAYSLMDHPGGRTWYTFTQGKVCFMALDGGSDHRDEENAPLAYNTAMTDEECAWITHTVQSSQWQTASFRVVLVHFPPCRAKNYDSQMSLKLISAILRNGRKPDLMLCGHIHRYFRLMPGQAPFTPYGSQADIDEAPVTSFPVMSNATCTGIFVNVHGKKLTARVLDATGKEVDSLSIEAEN